MRRRRARDRGISFFDASEPRRRQQGASGEAQLSIESGGAWGASRRRRYRKISTGF
jgi:hypothetical protein